jgi:hypothetical protein
MNIEIPDALAYELIGQHISDEIVERLASNELPADIGKWLQTMFNRGYRTTTQIAYAGAHVITLDSYIKADGSIELKLLDTNGCIFWQTTLRPVQS